MRRQEITFKPISSDPNITNEVDRMLQMLLDTKHRWFLYCINWKFNEVQFFTVTFDELNNSTDFDMYKKSYQTIDFLLGTLCIQPNSEFNYSCCYVLFKQLMKYSNYEKPA